MSKEKSELEEILDFYDYIGYGESEYGADMTKEKEERLTAIRTLLHKKVGEKKIIDLVKHSLFKAKNRTEANKALEELEKAGFNKAIDKLHKEIDKL